ncbi:MAG: hypothetical protein HQL48_06745 [Gammaproteobacteria bacterium]|nr:hypothetical protein [Gammaproteobacteria bacterium]
MSLSKYLPDTIKDFQQQVLDSFDHYLHTLVEKRQNADKVAELIAVDADLDLTVPGYTATTRQSN